MKQQSAFGQQDASRSVKAFLDLVERHQQSFYGFVHKVHTKGEALFSSLLKWIEIFLTFTRDGFGHPISLEYILPHSGQDRKDILAEVDAVALYHYKLKIAYEEKVQRRFGKEGEALNIDDQIASELLQGAAVGFDMDEVVQEEAEEIAGESSEYSSSEEETEGSSEYETDSNESPARGTDDRSRTLEQRTRLSGKDSKAVRPSKSMTFPRPLQGSRKNFDLPPLPLPTSVSRNHELLQHGSSNHTSQATITRSKTTIAQQGTNRVRRRPSDSAIHDKPLPQAPVPSKTQIRRSTIAKYPQLIAVPQLLPLFVELVSELLFNVALDAYSQCRTDPIFRIIDETQPAMWSTNGSLLRLLSAVEARMLLLYSELVWMHAPDSNS